MEKKKFFSTLCAITLLFFTAGLFNIAPAQTGTNVKFYIKTTSSQLFTDIIGADAYDLPELKVSLAKKESGTILWSGQIKGEKEDGKIKFQTPKLHPDLWSPFSPVLYDLQLTLLNRGREIHVSSYKVGFRDFETRNGQIFLNGRPVFLRGIAINPPVRGIPRDIEVSREFAVDYVRFMKSINVNIIRIPDNETWYQVCDELGMMVFGGNYSTVVGGESPPENYDKGVAWYENEKFQPVMHHPSLMIYALTNEVPYAGPKAPKWVDFLDYAHMKLKSWDPTRLYIGNAGYGYGQSGDICDLHRYWGWYYASPYTFLHIRDYDKITFPGKVQPLTFTECVGNYTGPDGRYNLTPDHKNPVSQQNWTGHAPQREQAMLADQHQCFVFKQATELMRRLRKINPESSGIFPFTIMFRNWHTIKTFTDMAPKPVAWQAQISFQPVLVSWENWQSQVYTGAIINPIAHIINDAEDFSDLRNVSLVVKLLDKAYGIAWSDTFSIPDILYYGIHSEEIEIKIPEVLFSGNYQLEGVVFSGDREVSRNTTELFIDRPRKNQTGIEDGALLVYDTSGATIQALKNNGIPFIEARGTILPDQSKCLLIGENSADRLLESQAGIIRNFVKQGGQMIVLRQDSSHQPFLKSILPVDLSFPRMNIDDPSYPPPPRPSRNSFNINPERPGHPVFTGIPREQLRIWSDYTGWNETKPGFPAIYPVTDGFILSNKNDIERTAVLANYSVGLEGIALAEFFEGNGSVLFCGFDLCNRSAIDPVADRLLVNMLNYMTESENHENHVLIDEPVLWGEYETEKGLLTGIYSGLMLNSRPALYGSYEKLPLIMRKGGHIFAEKGGGWNNAAGKQYVPYGRRMFGPYYHRDFGGVPAPVDPESSEGEGRFWCRVPEGTTGMETLVWNPAETELPVSVQINDSEPVRTIVKPGEYRIIVAPIKSVKPWLKVSYTGDRALVILETRFN